MQPVRIHVEKVFDFGSVVAITGIDLEANTAIVVQIDRRPLSVIEAAWFLNRLQCREAFSAEAQLVLNLDFDLSLDEKPAA
jgi:hypothetical protein